MVILNITCSIIFNMQFQINDKNKKDIFISIFQVLKNCSSIISCTFEKEVLHIQGIDKSHICLFDVKLNKNWFDEYIISEKKIISFDSNIFHSIISTKSDNQNCIFKIDSDNEDILNIIFTTKEDTEDKKEDNKKEDNKKEDKKEDKKNKKSKKSEKDKDNKQFKKFFKMSLIENEYDEMNIPDTEYDAEFTLSSKQVDDIFTQLNQFGNDIVIHCSEEDIYLTANGITGEMRVQIPIDDLSSYSIFEGQEVVLAYSLIYMNKMCITNKLSNEVEFSLSKHSPMKISYPLGEDSKIVFYIAPKLED